MSRTAVWVRGSARGLPSLRSCGTNEIKTVFVVDSDQNRIWNLILLDDPVELFFSLFAILLEEIRIFSLNI